MLDDALRTFSSLPRREAPALSARLSRILEGRGDLVQAVARAREVIGGMPALAAEYSCSGCGARYERWTDACRYCGAYGAVRLDLGAPDPDDVADHPPSPASPARSGAPAGEPERTALS